MSGGRQVSLRVAWTLLAVLAAPIKPGPAFPSDLLFARLTAERDAYYLQEVIDFDLAVYSRDLSLGRGIALQNREAPGLSFLPFQEGRGGREEVDGKVFEVHRFRGRAQAVATGRFAIHPSVRVEIVVPARTREAGRDGRSSGRAELRTADFSPPPLTVEVRPLPEAGRPEGFTGAVGDFMFSAALQPTAVAAGDPATLIMEIRGRGNIESVTAPRVQADERFTVYDPKLQKREIAEDRSGGRLVFSQVVVPRSPASTQVPAVTFSYFDPALKSYRRLSGGPFPLRVAPTRQPVSTAVVPPSPTPPAAKPAGGVALAPLQPLPGGWAGFPPASLYASPWFLALQVLPLGLLVGLWLVVRRRDALARDVDQSRRQRAPVVARAGIGAAEEALREGDAAGFHEALWQALASYFGQRLDLRPGEISRETIAARLALAGLDPLQLAQLETLFGTVEQARFSHPRPAAAAPLPVAERQRLTGLLEDLKRLLQTCDETAL